MSQKWRPVGTAAEMWWQDMKDVENGLSDSMYNNKNVWSV